MRLAFDSDVVSFFVKANQENGYNPALDPDLNLRPQRIATFRLFIYGDDPTIVPTVNQQLQDIPGQPLRSDHLRWAHYHWREVLPSWLNEKAVAARTTALSFHHTGAANAADCRMVAECEQDHVDSLATFDQRLIKSLRPYSSIYIGTPEECWDRLGVPPGAQPSVKILPGHPLFHAAWWRW